MSIVIYDDNEIFAKALTPRIMELIPGVKVYRVYPGGNLLARLVCCKPYVVLLAAETLHTAEQAAKRVSAIKLASPLCEVILTVDSPECTDHQMAISVGAFTCVLRRDEDSLLSRVWAAYSSFLTSAQQPFGYLLLDETPRPV